MKFIKFYGFFPLVLIIINFSIGSFGCSSDTKTTEPEPTKPAIIIFPQPLYFGQIPEGQVAKRDLSVSNIGDQALEISELNMEGTDAGLFTILGDTAQITVDPHKTLVFGVQFDPVTSGSFTAEINIISNSTTKPDIATLTGGGTTISGESVTFERIIGGVDRDNDGSVRRTSDGGYIVAGGSFDPVNEWGIASLFRLDKFGNLLWIKQYEGLGTGGFNSVVITGDDDFVVAGNTSSSSTAKKSIFYVKTDSDGNVIWQETWGDSDDDTANALEETSDGGYIIAGETKNTDGGGVKDALLIKIDGNGVVEWAKKYGTTEGEEANSVKQTSDNGYIFAGSTTVTGGDFDILLVKTSSDGTQEWLKSYGGSDFEVSSSVIVTADAGYIMAGYTASEGAGARDVYVIKTDIAGITEWTKTYGGTSQDVGSAIINTSDQGFLIVGSTESFGAGEKDVYIIKTDNSGNQSWQKTYGGGGNDGGSCVREVAQEGYIISGTSNSFGKDNDVYVLKLDANGMIGE